MPYVEFSVDCISLGSHLWWYLLIRLPWWMDVCRCITSELFRFWIMNLYRVLVLRTEGLYASSGVLLSRLFMHHYIRLFLILVQFPFLYFVYANGKEGCCVVTLICWAAMAAIDWAVFATWFCWSFSSSLYLRPNAFDYFFSQEFVHFMLVV